MIKCPICEGNAEVVESLTSINDVSQWGLPDKLKLPMIYIRCYNCEMLNPSFEDVRLILDNGLKFYFERKTKTWKIIPKINPKKIGGYEVTQT